MKTTTLRLAGLVAALLLAALVLPGGASARGPGAYRHDRDFGCLYTCGYDGGGCRDRCYRPCPCDDGGRWPPFAPIGRGPYEDAMRDYWDNSDAFKKARAQFDEDNAKYHTQAEWYQDCMERGGHCRRPGPPH